MARGPGQARESRVRGPGEEIRREGIAPAAHFGRGPEKPLGGYRKLTFHLVRGGRGVSRRAWAPYLGGDGIACHRVWRRRSGFGCDGLVAPDHSQGAPGAGIGRRRGRTHSPCGRGASRHQAVPARHQASVGEAG